MSATEIIIKARSFQQRNDKNEAIKLYSQILNQFPDSGEAKEAKIELQYLQKPLSKSKGAEPKVEDGWIPIGIYSRDKSIEETEVLTLINQNRLIGKKFGDDWFVNVLDSETAKITVGDVLFSFEGRIGRGTFWGAIISLFIFSILLQIGIASVSRNNGGSIVGVVAISLGILMVIVAISIYVKRWHDLNKSGWWVLTMFIPAINILVLLYLGIAPGTPSSNNYGKRPE
jgi:uncharacterized membrane protein YhaH (DUF805 family)